ncbi:hypothetical protein [Achromobacter xylosoxidans]|jgi:hypothetical protein|nr:MULTISPECIES: hypothetical protein [Achromobacter]MCH1988935.1 hypothetical protein [Achromobacter xylosoxidans]MCH1994200.1 hypothetical protein [Achromobacter xylosoxidans]MCH4585331.1 hypothetical protein [Achromobacter xylosoxidans]MDH0546857.1 hypothetical protein [Achromobacter xylosoxidans]
MTMHKPTLPQLAQAHAAARLRGTLADALRSPALARCLEITAQAMTQPRAGQLRPPPAAPPSVSPLQATDHQKQLCRDFKRASAADKDEL